MSEHELWNELGNLYFLSGAYDSALRAYTKAIEINRQFGRPYSNMALVYVQKGRYDRAIELAQYGIDLLTDPLEKAISWDRLGNVYRQCKDYSRAVAAYQKADELDPASRRRLEKPGRETDVPLTITVPPLELPLAARGMESRPEDAQTAMTTGQASPDGGADGSASGSLVPLEEPIPGENEVIPVSTPLFQSMEQETMPPALSLLDANAVGEAALESCHPYGPAETPIPSEDGTAEEESQDLPIRLQKTVENTMLTLLLTAPPARVEEERDLQLSELIRLAGQDSSSPESETPLPAAEAQDPICVSADAQSSLVKDTAEGKALPAVIPPVRKDVVENPVIGDLKVILERNPQDAVAWDALGNFYKSSGQYPEAISAYEQAIDIEPRNPSFRYHLGLVYAAMERDDEALEQFKKVIKLDPNDGLAHATLSGCYRRLGLDELARHHVEKAILLNNAFQDENEYNRACLESLCGNTERALEYLELALQFDPSYVQWALHDADLEFIREDPRFAALIARHSGSLPMKRESLYATVESAVAV